MHESSPSGLPGAFPPVEIYILGAGRFGRIAAKRLSKRFPEAEFLVVDTDMERLDRIEKEFNLPVRMQEAPAFMESTWLLSESAWIIPAVPIHLAFQWLLGELSRRGKAHALPVPESVDRQVPNPYRVPKGTVYTSFATFICPDACSEPDGICTHTGEPRAGNLYEELGRIKLSGFDVLVIRSWQLAPGVGGYPMNHLREALSRISRRAGSYLVATSCRCHGVIDCLETDIGSAGN